MERRALVGGVLWVLACAVPAGALDVVELANGDRISGEVQKMTDELLVLKTPYAKDDVAIKWPEVASLTTETPYWVKLTTGEYISARFEPRDDGVYLATETVEGMRPVELAQVAAIGVPPGARWTAVVAVGINGAKGNTDTLGVGISAEAIRETDDDRLRVGGRFIREQTDGDDTARNTYGWSSYDYYLTDHWYLTGGVTLEYDRFKDLDLRTVVGGGPGYRFIKTKAMLLQADVGLAYINENFREERDRDYVSAALGEEFRWDINEGRTLYQLLDVYPSLEDGKDVLVRGEVGYRHNVSKSLFVQVALIDEFDNQPAEGKEKNDFKYLVSLGYKR